MLSLDQSCQAVSVLSNGTWTYNRDGIVDTTVVATNYDTIASIRGMALTVLRLYSTTLVRIQRYTARPHLPVLDCWVSSTRPAMAILNSRYTKR